MRKQAKHADKSRPGKRPGLHGKKVKKLYTISPDIAEYLESQMTEGESASAIIESLIRKSRGFRVWQAKQG